jgi:hypothetical protein
MKKSLYNLVKVALLFIVMLGSDLNAQQWGLYTLYATKNESQAYLCDTNGTNYKTWSFSSSAKNAYSTYLVPGDTLVRTTTYDASGSPGSGGSTGKIQKVTWDGTVVWEYQYSSSTTQMHHDICPMPNGNVIFISYDVKSSADATQAGSSTASTFWSEKLVEVKPNYSTGSATIVWEWKLWDHLCQNYSSSKDNYVTSIVNNPQLLNINYAGSGNLPDRYHMNGIDYNEELDQIVVSMHFMNSVFVIDHSTTTAEAAGHTGGNSGKGGDFLYRWGNPASYGASGTTMFNTIHDAHWISSDNPNYPNYLCGYKNNVQPTKTQIVIWNPPYDGYNYSLTLGQAYAPSTYAYQYTSTFSANNEGNSQQLPNGNMLVNNSFGSVYEVNSAGTQVWTKSGTQSSHAYRFTKCEIRGPQVTASASATTVTAGTTVTLNSSAYSVTETSPVYTYSWSSSPAGFTSSSQNPSVTPLVTTIYTVTITDTNVGCSETATVTINVTPVGIEERSDANKMTLFPNPTTGLINIVFPITDKENTVITVYDLCGNVILQSGYSESVDLSGFENGIYFLAITDSNVKTLSNKIILIK